MNIVAKIDDWVARVNSSQREALFDDEAPASVIIGEAMGVIYPMWNWEIKRYPEVDWIEIIEARLPAPLPPSFRSLVSRYIFPEFDWGNLCLLANTPEGANPQHELRSVICHDEFLGFFLISRGYIPFARPATGDFDLVCFDCNPKGEELPIVRIDHESVFIDQEIRVTETLARDFLSWLDDNE